MGSSRAKRDDNAQALPAGRGETESIQHGPPNLNHYCMWLAHQLQDTKADESIQEGPLAQLVEQLTFNQLVAGSNPARPTTFIVETVVKQCRMRTMGSSRAKRVDNAQALPAGRGETESIQHGPPLLGVTPEDFESH